MQLLNFFKKRKDDLPPENEAARLNSHARKGLDKEILPDFDPDHFPAVSLNFSLTKTAIVIQWLRIMERSQSNPDRAKAVLNEFERLTFSSIPQDRRMFIVEHFRSLIRFTTDLKDFVESTTYSESDIARIMLSLSERWLNLTFGEDFADQEFICTTKLLYGTTIIYTIYEEMGAIGTLVGSAMFGEG